ncbi:EF-P lysine aminoacylase EpmA [Marinobacter changyiensis]|uniref:EF-P lysine aminoacylase EpmA n=1 Tax=Marinobacter changyiensis TaxID=2604091 RepID=UPI00126506C2|nr:EF-P lysine aminoacylase EpmA [Marinobacter changyiensis]
MSSTPDNSWKPTASLAALESRARQSSYVRDFFAARNVLEVETPALASHGANDLNIDSLRVDLAPLPQVDTLKGWLQSSPEYHMKRLLAAGAGPIYQMARAFRNGERGVRHNPEFSLLEWYRPGFDDLDLMAEVAALVCGWLELPMPERLTYREAFRRYSGVDAFTASDSALAQKCERWVGTELAARLSRDECLDLLLSHEIEPALRQLPPTFLCHYPASQAALAKTSVSEDVTVAHRFELYVEGLELCNGYWELTDATEQRRRFELDNQSRQAAGKPDMGIDERLLAAMESGLPACAGVALGLDRLLMLKLGTRDIAEVLSFPVERA